MRCSGIALLGVFVDVGASKAKNSVEPLSSDALAALANGDSLFDIDLSSVSRPPLWEPTLEEYFPAQRGGGRNEQGLPSPVVLTSTSNKEFVYHARKGYPIVVSDWGAGMHYDAWSGQDFAEKFPFGYMKAEYISDMPGFKAQQHKIKIIDGEQRFRLGDFKPDGKTMWYNFSRPASKRYRDDPLKPKRGPYVWHVKDELEPHEKKIVQARFEAPSFLDDALNREWMNRTFELWFSPGDHAGAGAHNDGYCESVVSLQLRGDKRWRKMLLPSMSFFDSFDEFDGGVYQAGHWAPDLGFLNSQGGAVIWPPGYLHETSTDPTPDGSCGAAITLQYAFPQPVQFIRAFLPRLSLSSEVGQCVVRSWSGWATLYVPGIKPVRESKEMEAQLDTILRTVDSDSDQLITFEEVRQWFMNPKSRVRREVANVEPQHEDLYVKFKAEDTVAYHDMNDDMVVSRQELWDSIVQWNVVNVRIQEGVKLLNIADRKGIKILERSLDRYRREPLQMSSKRLRPELQMLFELEKGTQVLKKLSGINSVSDSEFFERFRPRVEALHKKQARGRRKDRADL